MGAAGKKPPEGIFVGRGEGKQSECVSASMENGRGGDGHKLGKGGLVWFMVWLVHKPQTFMRF